MNNGLPITQEKLKELVSYNPATGLFYWRDPSRSKRGSGIAGSINKLGGYVDIKIDYKLYKAHRLVWLYVYGRFPLRGFEIDHINRVKDDNTLYNLREVTRSRNQMNRDARANSGYRGVHRLRNKKIRPYVAQVTINYKRHHIGYFDTAEEAHSAYVNFLEQHEINDTAGYIDECFSQNTNPATQLNSSS